MINKTKVVLEVSFNGGSRRYDYYAHIDKRYGTGYTSDRTPMPGKGWIKTPFSSPGSRGSEVKIHAIKSVSDITHRASRTIDDFALGNDAYAESRDARKPIARCVNSDGLVQDFEVVLHAGPGECPIHYSNINFQLLDMLRKSRHSAVYISGGYAHPLTDPREEMQLVKLFMGFPREHTPIGMLSRLSTDKTDYRLAEDYVEEGFVEIVSGIDSNLYELSPRGSMIEADILHITHTFNKVLRVDTAVGEAAVFPMLGHGLSKDGPRHETDCLEPYEISLGKGALENQGDIPPREKVALSNKGSGVMTVTTEDGLVLKGTSKQIANVIFLLGQEGESK